MTRLTAKEEEAARAELDRYAWTTEGLREIHAGLSSGQTTFTRTHWELLAEVSPFAQMMLAICDGDEKTLEGLRLIHCPRRVLASSAGSPSRSGRHDRRMKYQMHLIARRLTRCTGFKWEVDHVVPRAKGGTDAPSNLRVIPAALNSLKSDLHPFQTDL